MGTSIKYMIVASLEEIPLGVFAGHGISVACLQRSDLCKGKKAHSAWEWEVFFAKVGPLLEVDVERGAGDTVAVEIWIVG